MGPIYLIHLMGPTVTTILPSWPMNRDDEVVRYEARRDEPGPQAPEFWGVRYEVTGPPDPRREVDGPRCDGWAHKVDEVDGPPATTLRSGAPCSWPGGLVVLPRSKKGPSQTRRL